MKGVFERCVSELAEEVMLLAAKDSINVGGLKIVDENMKCVVGYQPMTKVC